MLTRSVRFYLFALLLPNLAFAAAPDVRESDPDNAAFSPVATSEEGNNTAPIDRYHNHAKKYFKRYVHRFDCFLAGRQLEPEPTGSWIRVIPHIEVQDSKGLTLGASFKAKIILPHLHQRLALIADNIPGGILPGQELAPEQYDKLKAGLRYKVLRAGFSMIDLDGGVNFNPTPAPFTKLSISHALIKNNLWCLELSQEGFLYVNDDGFGEMSQAQLTRALPNNTFAQLLSAATWSEKTNGLEWEQTLMVGRHLTRDRSIKASLSFFGHVDSESVMDNYRLRCTYRWNMFRPWLHFSLRPQISFPAEHDFRIIPLVRFCMEISCGDMN